MARRRPGDIQEAVKDLAIMRAAVDAAQPQLSQVTGDDRAIGIRPGGHASISSCLANRIVKIVTLARPMRSFALTALAQLLDRGRAFDLEDLVENFIAL
jgi:hypothetical protein